MSETLLEFSHVFTSFENKKSEIANNFITILTLSDAREQLGDPCRPKVAKKSDIVLPCGTEMEKVQFVAPLILYG